MLRKQLQIYSLVLMTVLFCSTSAYCQTVTFPFTPGNEFAGISLTHSNFSSQTTIGNSPNASIVLFSESLALSEFARGFTDTILDLPAVDSLEFSISAFDPDLSSDSFELVDTPVITNISGLGIFDGAMTSFTPASLSASSNAEAVFSIPNSTMLIDNAPIAEIFFDTSGLSAGNSFRYTVSGDFIDGDDRFVTANISATIATVVPEPSSCAFMIALGSTAMLRRKRA